MAANAGCTTAVGYSNGFCQFYSYDDDADVKKISLQESDALQVHKNNVLGMDFNSRGDLFATSSVGEIAVTNVTRPREPCVLFSDYTDNITNCIKFHPQHQETLVVGTNSGTLGIFDLRCDASEMTGLLDKGEYEQISKCHDIKSGVFKRSNVAISSLDFTDSNTVATGSGTNLCVKLWDLRMLTNQHKSRQRQLPCCVKEPGGKYNKGRKLGGIVKIVSWSSSRIWTLAHDGIVDSFNSVPIDETCPVHRIDFASTVKSLSRFKNLVALDYDRLALSISNSVHVIATPGRLPSKRVPYSTFSLHDGWGRLSPPHLAYDSTVDGIWVGDGYEVELWSTTSAKRSFRQDFVSTQVDEQF